LGDNSKALGGRTGVTEDELEARLASIEQQLEELKKNPAGASLERDPEFFGRPGQLDDVERKLEAVIASIEELRPGLAGIDERKYKETENAALSAPPEEVANATFSDEADFADDDVEF
jgi:hypothetical protein